MNRKERKPWSLVQTMDLQRKIVDSESLSNDDRHLLLTISVFISNETGDAQIAVPTLAGKLKLSEDSARRRINQTQDT